MSTGNLKVAIIYLITNKITLVKYVGCTTRTLNWRWTKHKLKAKNGDNGYLQNSMRKHGFDNFSIEVLENCYLKDMEAREVYWIEKLDTFNNGYNLVHGGRGNWGFKHSEEAKKKMSVNNAKYWKGKNHSDETKEKISLKNKGRKLSKETCKKMSTSRTGNLNHNRLRVLFELGKENFKFILESELSYQRLGKMFRISRKTISKMRRTMGLKDWDEYSYFCNKIKQIKKSSLSNSQLSNIFGFNRDTIGKIKRNKYYNFIEEVNV